MGSEAMVGANVHISGRQKPRVDNGAGSLCLSIKSSTVREVQVSHQRDLQRLDRLKVDSDPSVVTKVGVALLDTSRS